MKIRVGRFFLLIRQDNLTRKKTPNEIHEKRQIELILIQTRKKRRIDIRKIFNF